MKPYYDRDNITIFCGDCLEIMPQLEPPFDAIICDPPYGQTACAWDSVIPLQGMWINYKRLIKGNGAVVLFGSQPFTSKLVMSNLEWFKYEWIWDKLRGKGHLVSRYRPMQRTESILVFGKGSVIYNPQMEKRNASRFTIEGNKRTEIMGGAVSKNHKGQWLDEKYPTNCIELSWSPTTSLHPTQKPVALMSYLIRTYTNPGELILDNACGSGTTLVAAQNEGRRCTGIELSEEYCRIAVDRLRQPSFFSIPSNGKVKAEAKQLEIDIK